MRHTRFIAVAAAVTIAGGLIVGSPVAGASSDPVGELERLDALYEGAQPDSAARFRLHEERDRLAEIIESGRA